MAQRWHTLWFLMALVCAVIALPLKATAQTAPPPAPAAPPVSADRAELQTLLDILQNDSKRQILIEALKETVNNAKTTTEKAPPALPESITQRIIQALEHTFRTHIINTQKSVFATLDSTIDWVLRGSMASLLACALVIGARMLRKQRRTPPPTTNTPWIKRLTLTPQGTQTALWVRLVLLITSETIVWLIALSVFSYGWIGFPNFDVLSNPLFVHVLIKTFYAAVIVFGLLVLWVFANNVIMGSLDKMGDKDSAHKKRISTFLMIAHNALRIALIITGIMMLLDVMGIDITPIWASVGVFGLAIGFGAQKLVRDIINGIFIQLESAFYEGDVVQVGGIMGTVDRITVRSVAMRDLQGTYHIIPFSEVTTVSNYTRDFAYHVGVFGVAYKEKIPLVKAALQKAFDQLLESEYKNDILDSLALDGIVNLADSAVEIRTRIKTKAGMQWAVGRLYTELVKNVLDENGIDIPFPHRHVIVAPDTPNNLPKKTT